MMNGVVRLEASDKLMLYEWGSNTCAAIATVGQAAERGRDVTLTTLAPSQLLPPAHSDTAGIHTQLAQHH